jgi:hypothetical protein
MLQVCLQMYEIFELSQLSWHRTSQLVGTKVPNIVNMIRKEFIKIPGRSISETDK